MELPPDTGFAPALVEATQRASIGVLVATETVDGMFAAFANDRVVALLGRTPLRIPDDLGFDATVSAELLTWLRGGGPPRLELEALTSSGAHRKALHVTGTRVPDAERAGIVLFVHESLARQSAELAESEAQFRKLLDWAPDPVLLATGERFLYANPAVVRMLGYSHMDEMTRVPVPEHVHPDDRALARRTARQLLETGEPQLPIRFRVVRRDGQAVTLDVRTMVIEWDGERVIVMVARDLSERNRLRAQHIRADRLMSMGTLAAGVAHEINNPLAYLMLNLQFLMRELPRFDGDAERLAGLLERLAEAEHGARRVSAIVDDLRTFARPERLQRDPLLVTDAVTAAVKIALPQIQRRARLVEEYQPVPRVMASAARLEQVFVNLLVNAAHAIPEGNVEGNEVTVSVLSEGDRVIVEVQDTGGGIGADALGRVFEPFFTTKPRGLGTGLGLPISRGIVAAFDGEITVRSTVGFGSTFRVSLPAAPNAALEPPPNSEPQASAPMQSRPERARLLVVDDEPLVADMLRLTLSEIHDVSAVTDAETALEKILSGAEYDLIFCDLLMPNMSGMDLYEELKKRRPGVEERIAFMTGGAFTERAAKFLATVPNPKVTKPFDLAMLERLVARLTRKRS